MFKIFFFLSFLAMAFAKPGYINSHPIVTSYHHAAPAVHVIRPVIATHSIATPLIHHHGGYIHGSGLHGSGLHGSGLHGGIHHHGLY
ncbi:uncharacterized protein LOC131994338 [Stomoxys calcitrans]|uniref:uncharacterized protein LOC131994338 n=1 Tax=Stomoxys calcitrans TaxID=35570 RepID=UPI0027E28122|nr:uncharacterized protein LOC131994338 [Stomoxys calcitrans]